MKRQSQFKYEKALITSERLPNLDIDIRPLIVELVLYESLDKPFLTGRIGIADDQGIFDSTNFSGTERLHIQLQSEFVMEGSTDDVVMDRVFIMTGIEAIEKSSNSGNSSIVIVSLMDEHAFISKTKNISRSIKNDLQREIVKLCQNEVGKNVDLSYSAGTVQSNFRGVIPYMHPLEAASWLTSKATTDVGAPFFLYASMHDNNLRLGSLDTMLEQPAWNASIPYTYSPSNVQMQEENGTPDLQYFQIQSMKATKMQNTLTQLMSGGIGSKYTITDISTGRTTAQHFSIEKLLTQADEAGIISKEKQNIYNPYYKTPDFEDVNIEGAHLHDTDACIYHNVVSRGVYGDSKSLHDEVTSAMFLKKIQSASYRNMLFKNMYDITVPGPGFIKSGGSVGDKIRINVISDDLTGNPDNGLDQLRSGDFIVYNTRHQFGGTAHNVAMTVAKLEKGLRDE
jgi:hypothetical protein